MVVLWGSFKKTLEFRQPTLPIGCTGRRWTRQASWRWSGPQPNCSRTAFSWFWFMHSDRSVLSVLITVMVWWVLDLFEDISLSVCNICSGHVMPVNVVRLKPDVCYQVSVRKVRRFNRCGHCDDRVDVIVQKNIDLLLYCRSWGMTNIHFYDSWIFSLFSFCV